MSETVVLMVIIGMALVTSFSRMTPALILSNRTLPSFVVRWLQFVPAAVLAAMLVPAVLVQNGRIDLSLNNYYLIAAVPTLAIARKTRNLWWAVMIGMILVAAGRYFWGM